MTDLRVLIVGDDSLARAGLAAMLADQPGYTVVGQVSGEDDLRAGVGIYQPHVVVWDLGWDPASTLERIADLNENATPVVVLLPDEAHAQEAMAAGCRGLLLRDTDSTSLLDTLTAVAAGMVVLASHLAPTALPSAAHAPTPPAEALTPRELEVLRLLAEGLPNKAIAYRLEISEHTVKFHVNSILTKLNAQSRTEAVINATRLGLILL